MVEPKASPTDEIRPRLEHERLSRSSFPSRIFSRGRVSRGQRDRLLALMSPRIPLAGHAFPYPLFGGTIGSMRRSTIGFLVLLLAVLGLSLAACGADEAGRGPTTTVPGERSQSDPVETVEDEADGDGDEERRDDGKEKKKKDGKGGKDKDD